MKKNNAFTIAELVFVFIFIGVISIIAMHTVNNRFTDFYSRYSTAYDSLSKTVYHVYSDTYCRTRDDSNNGETDCKGTEFETGRPFPDNAQKLRKRLAEYLNVTKEYKDIVDKNNAEVPYISDSASESEFSENSNKVQLELTNGFRLFFSKDKTLNLANGEEIRYFIIYVDLNGAAKPNRANQHPEFHSASGQKFSKNTVRPDVVPFVATFNGDLIPVGFPVYDLTYASARVVSSANEHSKSYTIDEARQLAYGNDNYTGNATFSDMPLTLIPKIDLPKDIVPSESDKAKLPSYEVLSEFNCKKGTYNCQIEIDYNVGKRF